MILYLTGAIILFIILIARFLNGNNKLTLDILCVIIGISATSWVGLICAIICLITMNDKMN